MCSWLDRPLLGKGFLATDVEDVWHKPDAPREVQTPDDFYSFAEHDGLVYSIGALLASMFQFLLRICGRSDGAVAHHIDTTASGSLGQVTMTMIASIIPVLPIIAFYFVERLSVRIGLIGMFTAVFAAILVVGLQMKPDKTLAITTA